MNKKVLYTGWESGGFFPQFLSSLLKELDKYLMNQLVLSSKYCISTIVHICSPDNQMK